MFLCFSWIIVFFFFFKLLVLLGKFQFDSCENHNQWSTYFFGPFNNDFLGGDLWMYKTWTYDVTTYNEITTLNFTWKSRWNKPLQNEVKVDFNNFYMLFFFFLLIFQQVFCLWFWYMLSCCCLGFNELQILITARHVMLSIILFSTIVF